MTRTAFALSALVLFAAAQANAETVVVHTHDLKMPADAQLLTKRIQTAAMDVCGAPIGSSTQVVQEVRNSDCYRSAVTTAVASLPSAVKLASR